MKLRDFFTIAAVLSLGACSSPYKATDTGTTTTTVSVPNNIQTSFTTQYPGSTNVVWSTYDAQVAAPIDWELAGWTSLDADDYLVRFDLDNENYYGWYDNDGNWIGSAFVMKDYTQLPAPVNTVITGKYAGYNITSVNREFKKDRIAYEIELKKDDSKVKLLVDADGNIIKEKTKPI
ncbi:MAG: PepSY-like domain-containing protein [Chitinophagaceae bacterium]